MLFERLTYAYTAAGWPLRIQNTSIQHTMKAQAGYALIVIAKSLNQVNWSLGVAYFFSCPPKNVLRT